ncbi:PREDICTED: F-box protein SKIP16-like isoform X2 [Populus euphratica]|uniref:F-box protein SKIP16-like isoform X2 n=1 Tax=Populus euphratica TaxID=75702 RepID=A0AAJ6TIM4_POPEU|nr:PREDICTED: F-box protein SKIP16-like isoform X2 [Populus euphratica]
MGLESVGDLALNIILTKLGPKEIVKVSCVSKKFKDLASEESLWLLFCRQDLDLSAPLDHHGNHLPSFKATYTLWREAFRMYPWPLVKRVKSCWDRLTSWLTANFPEVKATLGKGASEVEIQKLERILKVKLPLPTRLLYRFHDGQHFSGKNPSSGMAGCPLGLIGGYCFYNHSVNVYLLSLREVISKTREIVRHLNLPDTSKYIVVAASSSYIGKFFFLNCSDGQLYVGTQNFPTDAEMMPCVPQALISPVHDFNSDQQQDAMLLWLEEHGRRLHNGMIKLLSKGNIKSISQFPEESPLCSTAVTSGVKVRASAVFVPEAADLEDISRKYVFAYSIRMSLLPEGCIINGMHFSSCQLHLRHWVISANDTVVSNINAEAVIGKFPLLFPGENEFVYESCTPLPTSTGSVEGSFTFVPGRLADPKGIPFKVEVGRFPLQLPDYIF